MKFTKIAALGLSLGLVVSSIAACSNEPEPVSSDINIISTQAQNSSGAASENSDVAAGSENYAFNYNGYDFIVDTEIDESKLPANFDVTMEASCAGVGLATTYKTSAFDVELRLNSDTIITRIFLKDDTVSTPEGIHIGSTMEEVRQAYGEPAIDTGLSLAYTKGSSKLQFDFKDDGKVQFITYFGTQDYQ
ncbi:MAG: hypothetical protein IKO15_06185 [Clostridiales bacterium]|jgi:hypothetical protein|nr:hypothetical protein [Clostridiales bacterium]